MLWHHRRSIRLKGYDYSTPGGYFITICTQDRERLFGKIVNGVLVPSEPGVMIARYWLQIEEEYENIKLDEYIIMPDHMHMILWIVEKPEQAELAAETGPQIVRAGLVPALIERTLECTGPDPAPAEMTTLGSTAGTRPAATAATATVRTKVSDIIGAFKSRTTCDYIRHVMEGQWKPFNKRIWQRNYYEHIIRNTDELNRIRGYIQNNPLKWELAKNRTNETR
jgi:putative transposase